MFYKKMRRFLETNVNRPYKNVYADFCALYPARLGTYTDTRKAFRKLCGTNGDSGYWCGKSFFYVTDKGILKKNPNSWEYRKKPKKTMTIGYNGEVEYHYEFNKKWLKYPDVENYLIKTFGADNVATIKEEEYIPNKIVNLLNHNYHWKTFFNEHKHWRDCDGWIYERRMYSYPIKVTKGTTEYDQYLAEEKQRLSRAFKRKKKELNEKLSTLLHDLEARAKAKEGAQDIIDRDRFGFDEESFKGEFYHGEKRKKK